MKENENVTKSSENQDESIAREKPNAAEAKASINRDIEMFSAAYEQETDPELKSELMEEWMIACHSAFMIGMFDETDLEEDSA